MEIPDLSQEEAELLYYNCAEKAVILKEKTINWGFAALIIAMLSSVFQCLLQLAFDELGDTLLLWLPQSIIFLTICAALAATAKMTVFSLQQYKLQVLMHEFEGIYSDIKDSIEEKLKRKETLHYLFWRPPTFLLGLRIFVVSIPFIAVWGWVLSLLLPRYTELRLFLLCFSPYVILMIYAIQWVLHKFLVKHVQVPCDRYNPFTELPDIQESDIEFDS